VRRILYVVGLLALLAGEAGPQNLSEVQKSTSGSITNANSNCTATSCVYIVVPQDTSTARVDLSGTFAATVQFETSVAGSSWSAITSTNGGVSSATAAGSFSFSLSGARYLRARASAFTSGPVQVDIGTAAGGATGPAGPTGPAGSGGGMTLLEAHTASSSPSLSFTSCFSSLYDVYEFQFIQLLPASNTVNFYYQVSTNGGSSYDSGTNYNSTVVNGNPSSASLNVTNNVSLPQALIFTGSSNNANWGVSGFMRVYNALTPNIVFKTQGTGSLFDSTVLQSESFSHSWNGLSAVNAIKFYFSSGTIASGTIRCYGFPKT